LQQQIRDIDTRSEEKRSPRSPSSPISPPSPNSPLVPDGLQRRTEAEDILHAPRLSPRHPPKSSSFSDLSSYNRPPAPLPSPPQHSPRKFPKPLGAEGRSRSDSGFKPKPSPLSSSISMSQITVEEPGPDLSDARLAHSPSIDHGLRERSRNLSLHLNKEEVSREILEVSEETLELLDQFDALFQDALASM